METLVSVARAKSKTSWIIYLKLREPFTRQQTFRSRARKTVEELDEALSKLPGTTEELNEALYEALSFPNIKKNKVHNFTN